MKSITIVTGLWNLNYDPLSDNLNKSYCSDREKFKELLKCDNNMCIYIDPSDEEFIWDYRSKSNTKIFLKKIVNRVIFVYFQFIIFGLFDNNSGRLIGRKGLFLI